MEMTVYISFISDNMSKVKFQGVYKVDKGDFWIEIFQKSKSTFINRSTIWKISMIEEIDKLK